MTICCLYNIDNNALLGVSGDVLVPQAGQDVVWHNRELPNFTAEEWNPATISFYTKETTTLTHLEFRRRFTPDEQELIDEFNVTFETHPALSAEQKRKVRTGLKNFESASGVVLADSDIPAMLGLYAAVGLLAPDRVGEILA